MRWPSTSPTFSATTSLAQPDAIGHRQRRPMLLDPRAVLHVVVGDATCSVLHFLPRRSQHRVHCCNAATPKS
jgi:hypothetical protein